MTNLLLEMNSKELATLKKLVGNQNELELMNAIEVSESFNELLSILFTSDTLLATSVIKICRNRAQGINAFDHMDIYQSVIEKALTIDLLEREYANKFNNLQFILADVKNIAKNIVATELNRQKKFYHSETANNKGIVYVERVGYSSKMIDKKETLIDIKRILDEKEFQAFQMYIDGYKVRDINDAIKNGRNKYDSMKKKLEGYYFNFYQFENGTEGTRFVEALND